MKPVSKDQKLLTTRRLTLKPLTRDDADWIQEKFNNWDIIQYLNANIPWPYPEDGAMMFLNNTVLPQMKDNTAIHWGIFLKNKTEEGIGVISFRDQADEYDGHRGFWMDVNHQGKGYMTEAVAAVNDFVFDVLEYDEFLAENALSNLASRRVKEKTGAVFLETKKRRFNFGDEEAQVWKITKQSWYKYRNSS